MIWSLRRLRAGVLAHRGRVTIYLDITYDGDMVSTNILYSKEAIEEVGRFLETREAHVNPAGGLRASSETDTLKFVMHNLTGD
jgi:hypothetical protein